MTKPSGDPFSLPAGPSHLCFDKNEFMKKTFSPDEFLHDHRNAASLEQMRDDLGVYLKVLRSAMIELINEDYQDFVNLSANLIGLDGMISEVQVPLERLRDEILDVQTSLRESMQEITDCLEEKQQLRDFKKKLQSLVRVQETLAKSERLVTELSKSKVNSTLLERTALEMIQLQFSVKICSDLMSAEQESKVGELQSVLLNRLKDYFLVSFREKDAEGLEKSLRIYLTLDQVIEAENIFRKEVVGPFMEGIISEGCLQNMPKGLVGIYEQILAFIQTSMTPLLALTGRGGRVKGFSFVLNSCWTEVEEKIELRMSSIFAPGNPDSFYQKFKSTQDFLVRLESLVEDTAQLHAHSQFKSFQTRWNLPVYFQIRFQEIATQLEAACSRSLEQTFNKDAAAQFKLVPFSTAIGCISRCWSDGVYLPQLFHRFFKLTLQFAARLASWIDEALQTPSPTSLSIAIYSDVLVFLSRFPQTLDVVRERLPASQGLDDQLPTLEKCLNEAVDQLAARLERIQGSITAALIDESGQHIRQVNDIPRLFRKTNREVPSRACPYVEQMLAPSRDFFEKHHVDLGEDRSRKFLETIFVTLSQQYHQAVTEVLTSVQKTEESLRRLKNLRERQTGTATTPADRPGMTDDDKIRLQLHVDVIHYTQEIEKLRISRHNIPKLVELNLLIEEATKIRIETK